ncbi:MAG: hypothetical protein ACYST5_00785 [Planctomycetota bacterium]
MSSKRKKISRREFLRRSGQVASGLVGAGALASIGCAIRKERSVLERAKDASANGAIYLERQSSGSEIWQVTTEEFKQSNIYCELPYCSGDSRHFVYVRHNPQRPGKHKTELIVVELGTWKQHRLDVASGIIGSAISHDGVFYYIKQAHGQTLDLMRVDLSKETPEKIYHLDGKRTLISLGTVSADARYYACGTRLGDDYHMFGIVLVDLQETITTIIDRDQFILNPHPQFEPGRGRELMIQHNRGGKYTPEGKRIRLVGPEGATLYLLSVPNGKRTELQVGKPFTTPATGHEAWIGRTGEILLTVMAEDDYEPDKGNLLAVSAGAPARMVAKGYKFNHVGVSRCGRFFCCDDWQGTAKLVIGSIQSGKTAVVCESKTSMGSAQNTHSHAYLTPDLKWVIFNSDRSGFPHVHAASVPEGMIEELSKA